MAEQNPVVVSEEETPAAQNAAVKTAPDSKTNDTTEFVGFATASDPDAVDDEGRQRIRIDPVTLPARPKAGVENQQVDIVAGIPPVRFKSLEEVAPVQEALERAEKPGTTYEDAIAALERGDTIDFSTQEGTTTYSPRVLPALKANPQLQRKFRDDVAIDSALRGKEVRAEPVIAGADPSATRVDVDFVDSPVARDRLADYASNRLRLNTELKKYVNTGNKSLDTAIRQYFIDDFTTGEFTDALLTRLAETGRAIPTLPTYGTIMANSALEAWEKSREKGTPFSDEYAMLSEERERQGKAALEAIDSVLDGPTAAMAMNNAIRARAKLELDEGRFTQEQYDNFVFTTDVTGEKIERDFITDEAAYGLIEFAFTELPELAKPAVIITENLLGGGIFGMRRAAAGTQYLKQVNNLRKQHNIPLTVRTSAIPAWAKQNNIKLKVDDNLLELGIFTQSLRKQNAQARTRRKELSQEMNSMRQKNSDAPGTLKYKQLEAEYDNLGRQTRRNFLSGALNPYTRKVLQDEVIIGMGAYAGQRFLPGIYDIERDTGEMLGFFSSLLLQKPVKFLAKKAGGLAKGFVHTVGIGNPVPMFMRKLMQMDMTVDDYERLVFEPSMNRKMNMQERKGMRRVFKEIENMPIEDRQQFMEAMQFQMDLRSDVIRGFPEGSQQEVEKLFDLTFAEITGLPPLIGAVQQQTEGFTMKGMRKMGFSGTMDAVNALEDKASQASVAIQNFENYISTYANPQSKVQLTNLLETAKAGLISVRSEIDRQYNALNLALDDVVDAGLGDVDLNLPESFMTDVFQTKRRLDEKLSKGTPGETLGQEMLEAAGELAEQRDLAETATEALERRFQQVKGMRDNKDAHRSSLSSALEALAETRYAQLADEADAPYNSFRLYMSNRKDVPRVDISPMVSEMLALASADEKNITTFFGPQATFFSGFMGRRSREMFSKMVRRSLDDIDPNVLSEMVAAIKEADDSLDAGDIDALIQNDPTQFGLLLHSFGKINVFAHSTIEEAEEFRRAFRDYGHKTTNEAVSREFKNWESMINKAMEDSDPEGYKKLAEAREIYRSKKDPLRPGSPLQKIKSAQVGEKVNLDSGPFASMYKNNQDPTQVFGQAGEAIKGAMKGGRDKPAQLHKLERAIGDLEQLFGEVGPDGKLSFNLDTEDGRKAFRRMQEVTDAIIFDAWAADFLEKAPIAGQRLPASRLEFRASVLEQLQSPSVQKSLEVSVIDGGVSQRYPITDLSRLVAEEQDILKLVADGQQYHEIGKEAARILTRKIKEINQEVKLKQAEEQKVLETLNVLVGLDTPRKFYDMYIAGAGDVDLLREQFIQQMSKDPAMKGADLASLFDEAIYKQTYQALLEVGEYKAGRLASARAVELGRDADTKVIKQFGNTLGALSELTNPSVRGNLEKIMDPKQVQNLENILRYLANQEGLAVAGDAIAKGMSANEAISRAYNIARGMVSPQYIASEVAVKLMQKNSADAFYLAIQSKEAAAIMDKMLRTPKMITPKELKTFNTLLIEFACTDVIRKGQEEATEAFFTETGVNEEGATNEQTETNTSEQ